MPVIERPPLVFQNATRKTVRTKLPTQLEVRDSTELQISQEFAVGIEAPEFVNGSNENHENPADRQYTISIDMRHWWSDLNTLEKYIYNHGRVAEHMGLIHVCLNVTDVEKSIQFYTEQLGFEESWSFESGDTVNRYVTDDNGVELQLSDTSGVDQVDVGTAWDHLALSVESVDDAFERIDHFGTVQEPQDQPAAGARTAFIEDPDGHVVELVEPLDE